MSTCIERGFHLTYLQPEETGFLRPIGIGEKFLMGHLRIEVYQWIILNKKVLLDHWNLKIDSLELGQRIIKLE